MHSAHSPRAHGRHRRAPVHPSRQWVRLLAAVAVVVAMSLPRAVTAGASASANPPPTTFLKTLAGASVAPMYPSGLVYDPYQNRIVIADTGLDSVDIYSPVTGQELSTFGSVGTGNGQFQSPREVAVDPQGNIYVADAENNRVQAFDTNGNWKWTAGGTGSCAACLNTPIGVTWDTQNSAVIVADTGQSQVKAYDNTGKPLWQSPHGLMSSPREATRGPDGRVWVADYNNQAVEAFDVTSGGSWTAAAAITLGDGKAGGHNLGQLNFPYDAAFSPDGNTVYVADTGNDRIARWDLTTSPPTPLAPFGSRCVGSPCTPPGTPIPANTFEHLRRVSVDPSGNIWAADFWGSGIHEFHADGTTGREIDGFNAPAPGFAQAYSVAVGPDGATYAVDRLNQRVEAFSSTGSYVGSAGQRGVVAGDYSWPEAVAVAPDKTVWVGDTRNGRLEHYLTANLSDAPTTVGSKGSGPTQFNYIDGLTVDTNGVVWAADASNNRIHNYNPSTKAQATFGTTGSGPGQFNNPQGVAVSLSANRMYVADTGNNRIEALDLAGNYIGSFSSGINGPEGITLAPDGTIWVANTQADTVVHLSAFLADLGDGFGGLGTGTMQFELPHSLAVSNGVLFVADTYNNRVQEFTLGTAPPPPPPSFSATYSSQYSQPSGTASLYPDGGVLDAAGNLYVTDMGNSRVVKITPGGVQSTLFATGLSHPRGIALDPGGTDLWIPDSDNNRLVEIDLSGRLVTSIGTSALHSPYGVTFLPGDPGSAYVADTYNFDVVKLDTTTGAVLWKTAACQGVNLQRVRAITTGSDGNLYASDTDNNRVVELAPSSGTCLNAFGSKGSGPGQFIDPRGITSDGSGGLWVGDDGNYRVEHFTLAGQFIAATATTFGSGPGQLNAPQQLFMDGARLAVADTYNYRIELFDVDPSGVPTYSSAISGTPPANGGFNEPWEAAYGPSGELYVVDSYNFRIEAFNPDGSFDYASGTFGTQPGAFELPRGIAVSADGATLAVAQESNNIELLNASNGSFKANVAPKDHSGLRRPRQVTFSPDGTLWVADFSDNRVVHMDQTGNVLLSITNGGKLKQPQGVALDSAGNVYVADTGNNTIEEYSATSGSLLNTLATGGSGPANVSGPAELTVAGAPGAQVLLIADSNNNRVQVLTTAGQPVTTFGTAGSGPGQLSSPNGVAFRPSDGQVAVAEFANSRISLWNSTGATVVGTPTTTTAGASPASVATGAPVTLTAAVTPTPNGGTVAFTSNGSPVSGCAATPVDPTGAASCATSFAGPGTYSIVASYSGNTGFSASTSAAYALTVGSPVTPTTTTASLSSSTVAAGSTVTLSAAVSPLPDGGTVAFTVGGSTIKGCAAHVVTSAGTVRCMATFSSPGPESITAVYSGDPAFGSSTSAPVVLTVGPAATATSTTASASPAAMGVGSPTTLTATVGPVPDGGTVGFVANGVTIPACKAHALNSAGTARCTTSFTQAGAVSITAVYSGDSSFASSTSAPVTVTVG